MAITVFSKNYASSTFCLNELVKIHECIKMKGGLVLPIFYDVEPSTVRHQKDDYEQALSMHSDKGKIQSWMLALYEVANISGYHFTHGKNVYEHEFIEQIVKEISSKIERVPLHVSEYPIGLESRVKEITSLLQIELNEEVIMVGICGMGGLGKTTIARALYNSIADNFNGLCFVDDVKEQSREHGLKGIQKTILSTIVGAKIKIQDVNGGVEIIKRRFKEKKILLILDNVDNHEQLKKLAGGCDWFGGGSRIIITTRDAHLLVSHGVQRDKQYYMKAFNPKESLELLRWNAFRTHQVDPSYKDVLNRAIVYAQGLPLALETVGANLYGMSLSEWESALDLYERIPEEKILKILKVSYDGLTKEQQKIFLDIACFFRGKELEHAKSMVEQVYNFNPEYVIRVLVNKFLMKIVKNLIEMHDLIQDMGREIVREESPNNNPGERSRLWSCEDIADVLEHNRGTDKVRMIIQDNSSECIEVNWEEEAFKRMTNLEVLSFENVKFSQNPKFLPNSLKVLTWNGNQLLPKKPAVGYFESLLTIQNLDKLGVLRFTRCENITKIPNLSNLRNLKELILRHCRNLSEVDDSIGCLAKLENLDVRRNVRLNTFPRKIELPSLKELQLECGSSMTYFAERLEIELKIRQLDLRITGIGEVPWSLGNFFELRDLWIEGNNMSVIKIPSSIFLLPELGSIWLSIEGNNESVIEIPSSIFLLPNLQGIKMDGNYGNVMISCTSIEDQQQAMWSKQCLNTNVSLRLPKSNISDDILGNYLSRFINLSILDLTGSNITILPSWFKQRYALSELILNECKHLREVEGAPPFMRLLQARNCVSLSMESKSLLLSEKLLRRAVTCVSWKHLFSCVPSRSIPELFDHKSKGASISFWFRNSFPPALCLCLLLKPEDDVLESNYSSYSKLFLLVSINGAEVHRRDLFPYASNFHDRHLFVYYLKQDKTGYSHGNEWNHVQIVHILDVGVVIEENGMYVIKQLCDMQHIRFNNPDESLDSTRSDQEQFDPWMMEEKQGTLNKKRRLMGDDNFASSSTIFGCTKGGRNSSIINEDDNNANPPDHIPFANYANEIIHNKDVEDEDDDDIYYEMPEISDDDVDYGASW